MMIALFACHLEAVPQGQPDVQMAVGRKEKVKCLKNFSAISDIRYEVNISKTRNPDVYGNNNYRFPCYSSLL